MKKLGKLFAVLFILGLTITTTSCNKENEYYESPGNPIAPGTENPIAGPSVPGHH